MVVDVPSANDPTVEDNVAPLILPIITLTLMFGTLPGNWMISRSASLLALTSMIPVLHEIPGLVSGHQGLPFLRGGRYFLSTEAITT
jgi:hypothetical protein